MLRATPSGATPLRTSLSLLAAAALATVASFGARPGFAGVDPALPEYATAGSVTGTIASVGSDTLNEAMTLWSEGFKGFYPSVNPATDGKGSATAPPALIAGTSLFGPMSREMKAEEVQGFEAKFGYKPTAVRVALD